MNRHLLKPDDFFAWQRANDARLQDVLAENKARVADAVIRQVMASLSHRVGLDQAGDAALKTLMGTRDGVCFTREGVRTALRSIGWKSKRERNQVNA